MGWQTFIDWCRFDGRDLYILRQSKFDFDVADRILRGEADHILVFDAESDARQYASLYAEDLQARAPELLDLDAVGTWCDQPDAATLDANSVWRAWHLLSDAGASRIPLAFPGEPGYDESELFDNLLLWATAANSEWHAAHKRPWQPEDVRTLARILGEGLEKFATLLAIR